MDTTISGLRFPKRLLNLKKTALEKQQVLIQFGWKSNLQLWLKHELVEGMSLALNNEHDALES